jgi:hypothetical protein
MPFTAEEHLNNLTRHIDLVRDAGLLLGKRLMNQGRKDFGRILIGHIYVHDASKFHGIEWDYLHAGKDVSKDKLDLAVKQHIHTNPHHPEYWGGFDQMPEIFVAECVCDWYARAQEFGTGLRQWITDVAIDRFKIDPKSKKHEQMMAFVDLLLEDSFVRN